MDVAQVIHSLPSKHETLSSFLIAAQKRRRKRKKKAEKSVK
jgi:hypothetical protein